jgi:hypothetical protein
MLGSWSSYGSIGAPKQKYLVGCSLVWLVIKYIETISTVFLMLVLFNLMLSGICNLTSILMPPR